MFQKGIKIRTKIVFGTDGWRGLLDDELNNENIGRVAAAFSAFINDGKINSDKKVAVGYDGRKNSRDFAVLFSKVLSAYGIQTFLSDKIIPTPLLSYFVKAMKLDAGVMVTASHNPPSYNGIKFKSSYGGPFITEETHKVESLLDKFPVIANDKLVVLTDFTEIYFNQVEKFINFDLIRRSGISIMIDSMCGAGQQIIRTLLSRNGCTGHTIYNLAETDFRARMPEPIAKNLNPLSEALKNGNFAFGVATDGDADRAGFMMENGEWLSAQETILYIADFLINVKKLPGGLVKTSSVSDKLVRLAEKSNRELYNVQVGFKYICEKMISHDIVFGAEESGGFGYRDHMPERDGILSGLIMSEMIAASGYKDLSSYVKDRRDEFGYIHYDRIDIEYHNQDRIELLPSLYEKGITFLGGEKINMIQPFMSSRNVVNGLKFTFDGDARWLLIRSSETEPLLRFYAEGSNDDDVKKLLLLGKQLTNIN